ncbi:MAG: hypothetical protein HYZ17_15555 [Betaproteobacteria bacterium]|nr:hypothetical protein [Betaproteobacteria bacterium]
MCTSVLHAALPQFCFVLLMALVTPARADDADALRLADEAPRTVARERDWRGFAEIGLGAADLRADGSTRKEQRVSLDLQVDHALSPQWRAVLADRLDVSSTAQHGGDKAINTLKEAYFSGRVTPDLLIDCGRINARYGVAMGYNPTDYFRGGALRSKVSIDPASLKENRQGSVLLRGQKLWDGGALTLLASPRISSEASSDGFSLDWGATNARSRAMLVLSAKFSEIVNPQFVVYKEEARSAQWGGNITGLIGQATVAYLEWSGGSGRSHWSAAVQQPASGTWRNRMSAGLTFTAQNKLSFTAEAQYDGAALADDAWRTLRAGSPLRYVQYRNWVAVAQELPTQRALFFRAFWQDALVPRFDLSAMVNVDLADNSRRAWLEARYRAEHIDYVLQWQGTRGAPMSNYGALPESWRWQVALKYYF